MPHPIKVAAIQMDANPAPTATRLERAGLLVSEASQAGAHLVVLPELFNTGYGYTPENHAKAEPIDGITATWMKETAARHNLYLAGALMLREDGEVYNALLLYAPGGQLWRYDKQRPWGWERGYFRAGHGITVARTELGDLGFLICWDAAHPELWKRYAGRVDMMVISSCPPDVSNPTYHFPGGDKVTFDDMGPLFASMKGLGRLVFGDMINQQTAWLGVPAVNTVGCGHLTTDIPNGRATLLAIVPLAPWLARYLPQAGRMRLSCNFVPGCKVVSAEGQVLTELAQAQGESLIMSEVILADNKPAPKGPQPGSLLPWISYFTGDVLLPLLTVPVYRRAFGRPVVPIPPALPRWLILLGAGAAASVGLGVALSNLLKRKGAQSRAGQSRSK